MSGAKQTWTPLMLSAPAGPYVSIMPATHPRYVASQMPLTLIGSLL